MWGQETSSCPLGCHFGIIPMRVGTRIGSAITSYARKDHPHACGDKKEKSPERIGALGSSPCVWGQAIALTTLYKEVRIIPMRVGTSQTDFSASAYLKDHPHACGDKLTLICTSSISRGSSPCVWGQGPSGQQRKDKKRIIPMRVGTSI